MIQTAYKIPELDERIQRIEALTEKQAKELEVTVQRIAQIQAQLEEQRVAFSKVK
jgi:predicted  nucleic acid-binding Zn-ribbon protein